jgi:hypothetical protein
MKNQTMIIVLVILAIVVLFKDKIVEFLRPSSSGTSGSNANTSVNGNQALPGPQGFQGFVPGTNVQFGQLPQFQGINLQQLQQLIAQQSPKQELTGDLTTDIIGFFGSNPALASQLFGQTFNLAGGLVEGVFDIGDNLLGIGTDAVGGLFDVIFGF